MQLFDDDVDASHRTVFATLDISECSAICETCQAQVDFSEALPTLQNHASMSNSHIKVWVPLTLGVYNPAVKFTRRQPYRTKLHFDSHNPGIIQKVCYVPLDPLRPIGVYVIRDSAVDLKKHWNQVACYEMVFPGFRDAYGEVSCQIAVDVLAVARNDGSYSTMIQP